MKEFYATAAEDRVQADNLLLASMNHADVRIARKARMLHARHLLKEDPIAGVNVADQLRRDEQFAAPERAMIAKQLFHAYLQALHDYENALAMLAELRAFGDEDWENGLLSAVFEDVTGVQPVLGPTTPQKTAESDVTVESYPNPFNSSTIINYTLARPGPVTLRIFDMLGRQVATLVDKEQQAGEHTAFFDASALRSGIYIYQVETREATALGQMHLVK